MIRTLLPLLALAFCPLFVQGETSVSLAENNPAYDSLIIQHRGRLKPFLSFAQELTASLTGRTSVSVPKLGKISSRQLILSLWLQPTGWENEPIILVEDPALQKTLNLAPDTRHFPPVSSPPSPNWPTLPAKPKLLEPLALIPKSLTLRPPPKL